jgi:hypothetical protein
VFSGSVIQYWGLITPFQTKHGETAQFLCLCNKRHLYTFSSHGFLCVCVCVSPFSLFIYTFISFLLQPVQDPKKMTQIIVEALETTGQRGIISKGWGGLGNCKDIAYSCFHLSSLLLLCFFNKMFFPSDRTKGLYLLVG